MFVCYFSFKGGETIIDQIGGRKFLFALYAMTLGFVLVLTKFVHADAWLGFINLLGATYIVGNVADGYIAKNSN